MGKTKPGRRPAGKGKAKREATNPKASGVRRDVAAVVLFALGLALLLALGSYSSVDGALLARGLRPASNLVGPVGHRAASAVYGALGFAALVLPAALALAALELFRGEPRRVTIIATAAYAILTVSAAALAHLALSAARLASFPPGGAVGAIIAGRAEALLSTVGSGIVLSACALAALIVAAQVELPRLVGGVYRAFAGAGAFAGERIAAAVARHREAIAELRAEEEAERAREALEAGEEDEPEQDDDEDEDDDDEEDLEGEPLDAGRPGPSEEDPLWTRGLPPGEAGEDQGAADPQRRKRRAAEAAPEPAAAATATPAGGPPASPEPPRPPVKPEIVLSPAMKERGRKKDKEPSAPAFAFTKAGEVFRLPDTSLLDAREVVQQDLDAATLTRTAEVIVATLRQHGVEGVIRHIRPGPVVTLYEFIPAAGVKLARIENLDKELTMALSAIRIRIIAPIPGKGVVGIEVPNRDRATVFLRDVLESESFARAGGLLPLALGKNIEGIPYCVDLQKMPHLLIAGTTGSGKSVGLNTMILSLLYRQTPAEVRMIMVDPKMTELSIYEEVPHLLLPVVTDPHKAARALQWAVDEMERRTQILADTGSKDLKSYNGKVEKLRAEGMTFAEAKAAAGARAAPGAGAASVAEALRGPDPEGQVEPTRSAMPAPPEDEADGPSERGDAFPEDAGAAANEPLPGFTPLFEDPTEPPPYRGDEAPPRRSSAQASPSPVSGQGPPPPPLAPVQPHPAGPVLAARASVSDDTRRLPQKLPYILVVIDELADLMMTAPREVEISLARLAQKARATGIHLMVATQRPSTDVITGMIKNNFPARISFRLASRHDSQTIINGPGAETLLGDGDMLVLTATQPVTRVQGAFVSEGEIERVVGFLKEQGRPVYDESILKAREGGGDRGEADEEDDPVYDQALELVAQMEEVSVSKLQREMRLGYNKAAKIIERMEREGVVGPANGVKPRQVLIRPAGEASPIPNV